MNNPENREDCPGDDHPVKPKAIDGEFLTVEKWVICSCIAVLIILGIVIWRCF